MSGLDVPSLRGPCSESGGDHVWGYFPHNHKKIYCSQCGVEVLAATVSRTFRLRRVWIKDVMALNAEEALGVGGVSTEGWEVSPNGVEVEDTTSED